MNPPSLDAQQRPAFSYTGYRAHSTENRDDRSRTRRGNGCRGKLVDGEQPRPDTQSPLPSGTRFKRILPTRIPQAFSRSRPVFITMIPVTVGENAPQTDF